MRIHVFLAAILIVAAAIYGAAAGAHWVLNNYKTHDCQTLNINSPYTWRLCQDE